MLYELSFVNLLSISLNAIIEVLFTQPIFYLLVFMIYWQYKKIAKQQKQMFGYDNMCLWKMVLSAIYYGVIGGMFASVIVLFSGLSINKLGFEYLWPLAVFLFLINMRFMCFAYAGGILAAANMIFGWPDIVPTHLLALVGILHITEALLVFIDTKNYFPAYFYFKGRAVGGFILNSFWPLPFILLFVISLPAGQEGFFYKPPWWPLFPMFEQPLQGQQNYLFPIAVSAILAYSSVAVGCSPREKRQFSAKALFFYSITLLLLAYLSITTKWLTVFAALFCTLGHEFVIYIEQKEESEKKPIYVKQPDNFVVLSTIYNSPVRAAGLKEGDIIVKLNGNRIFDDNDFLLLSDFLPPKFTIEVLRQGKTIVLNCQKQDKWGKVLGIIRMPDRNVDGLLTFEKNYSLLKKLYEKIKR